MQISEVIRKYRKEQNLTQEQVANYLGVTAPAVNKWESGASYPDITLLAPLARLLKTDVDTLLSFREELTDAEINKLTNDLSEELASQMNSDDFGQLYDELFNKAKEKIQGYPKCYRLLLNTSQVLNGFLLMRKDVIKDTDIYKRQLNEWLCEAAQSSDSQISNIAIMSLSQNYMNEKKYDEAQNLLDKIPPLGFDKRIIQANLYREREEFDKAYKIHEGMVFQNACIIIGSLMQMSELLIRQGDYDAAMEYADMASDVAIKFDLGSFIGESAKLQIYVKKKDEEGTLKSLEKAISSIDKMNVARESKLYKHMKFKEDDGILNMKKILKRSFDSEEEFDFIKDNPKFKELIKRLE